MPQMFSDADKHTLFTREMIQERLGDTVTVEWLLRELKLSTRCKGRVVFGSDILRALENPPPAAGQEQAAGLVSDLHPTCESSGAGKPRRTKKSGTCADIQTLQVRKSGA